MVKEKISQWAVGKAVDVVSKFRGGDALATTSAANDVLVLKNWLKNGAIILTALTFWVHMACHLGG